MGQQTQNIFSSPPLYQMDVLDAPDFLMFPVHRPAKDSLGMDYLR